MLYVNWNMFTNCNSKFLEGELSVNWNQPPFMEKFKPKRVKSVLNFYLPIAKFMFKCCWMDTLIYVNNKNQQRKLNKSQKNIYSWGEQEMKK